MVFDTTIEFAKGEAKLLQFVIIFFNILFNSISFIAQSACSDVVHGDARK